MSRCDLSYDEATWESRESIETLGGLLKIQEYEERQLIPDIKKESEVDLPFTPFTESKLYKGGNTLRSYQLEGLNWLAHCYHEERNSILGDEMGLGKTIQSTVFLHYLYTHLFVTGPFIVIVPLSTLGNWERELRSWTDMNIVVFRGRDASRTLIVDGEFYYRSEDDSIVPNYYKFDVLLTTYDMVNDPSLRSIPWRCAVLDEAHKLKNKHSKISQVLKSFSFDHKILLTGTPYVSFYLLFLGCKMLSRNYGAC